ncbi:site-specific integrase [Marinilactibacillus psychrotolerans]|uniref:site-specific integrase n=1 Tax=Marinilactibacillus psychrotolerans TaxID=191770 RepID=UPI00388390FD
MAVKQDTDGSWFARVSYKDKQTGKYKTKSQYGFKRKKDADQWERSKKNDLEKGFNIGANPYFFDYYSKWVETYKTSPNVAVRTQNNYLTTMNIIKTYFEHTPIKSINKMNYQAFLNDLSIKNAISTNQKINKHIRACLKDALEDGLVPKDFTQGVTVAGKPVQAEEEKFLSEAEMKKLLLEIRNGMNDQTTTRWMALIQFAGGLRYSEVAGLTYDDFKSQTLRINKAWSFAEKKHVPTKNELKRTIKIEPSIAAEFKSYILRQKKNNLKSGISNKDKLVFVSSSDSPPTHAAMNKSLKRACKRADIKEITSHALRHTHVSLLIYHGMDIVSISKRIGHKSPTTTIEKYSHIINELEHRNDEISDKMIASFL